ncbi:hypothetical protein TCAL_10673 [Tigriopus californicus]|uniref:Kazal-like domain-containing protein n=1 Tax=Tigriopus californicus TaxID=6832 RepID=A0A553P0J6_TIGCA|nr:serine protease inhibitor dipetalogastin-like [Tigriopus californicus]TRY71200.1 hypothetical protein TCAL_10673 [Tigriopus californicus]
MSITRVLGLALILALDLVQGQDQPFQGPYRCICQLDLRPVCGVDGFDYPNICTALCQRVVVACQQRCPCPTESEGSDSTGDPIGGSNTTTTPTGSPILNNSSFTLSPNSSDGHDEAVKDQPFFAAIEGDDGEGVPSCSCEENNEPVCGDDNTTYSNNCQLECAQVNKTCAGECPCGSSTADGGIFLTACRCPDVYEPICGQNGETYQNACFAGCKAVLVDCEGKCPCLKSRARSIDKGQTGAFD